MAEASKVIANAREALGTTNFEAAVSKVKNILDTQNDPHKNLMKRVLFLSDGEDGSDPNAVDNVLK
jgi:hypothetical protein